MAVGLIAAGVVGTLLGGISSYLQSKAVSKAAKAQGQQLKNNMKMLQDEIERGEIEMNEALVRIDELIGNTKGEIKGIMEKQVDLAVGQVKDQMRIGLETTMKNIREDLGRRRLFGSEAGQEIRRKTAAETTEQAAEQVTSARERAANMIAAQISQLTLKGGLAKEGRRTQQQQFRLGALGEVMQLESMATTLGQQAQQSPWLDALVGAIPGLTSIAGQILGPGQAAKETPTGTGIPEVPATIPEIKKPDISASFAEAFKK